MNFFNYITTESKFSSFEELKQDLQSEKFGLRVKEDKNHPSLYLVTYNKDKSNMESDVVKDCRGIILEKETNKVVCLTFKKSENTINKFTTSWEDVTVQKAVDGTQIKLYNYNGQWIVGTTRCINAIRAKFYGKKSFYEMFLEASKTLNYSKLNPRYCYSFVLCHPENIIVTKYESPHLVHTLTIDLDTMKEVDNVEIDGISKPANFVCKTYEEFVEMVKNDNNPLSGEGYVLTLREADGNISRIKQKTEIYKKVKELRGNTTNQLYNFFRLIKKNELQEYLKYYPENTNEYMKYYEQYFKIAQKLHYEYIAKNIRKTLTFLTMSWYFKPHVYELHKLHITNQTIITINVVHQYLINLDPAQLCFIYLKSQQM